MCRAMKHKFVCPEEDQAHKVERTNSFHSDVEDFAMPAFSPKKQRSAASATVLIGIQHFSDNSELRELPGAKDKVVVIMMKHNAWPSYFSKFADTFAEFLTKVQKDQEDFPKDNDEFARRYAARFVMASDPPLEKQKPYARGAYVKLRLAARLVEVLDSFIGWRYESKSGGTFPPP